MTDLTTLSRRVSEAEGPSRGLDANVAEAIGWRASHDPWWNWHKGPRYDPPGDEWCIRRDGRSNLPCNEALPAFTASLDAVAALIAEKLPGWAWSAGVEHEAFLMPEELPCSGTLMGNVRECQPAFDEPPEIAYDHHERKAKTPALALLSAALLAIHERNKSDE